MFSLQIRDDARNAEARASSTGVILGRLIAIALFAGILMAADVFLFDHSVQRSLERNSWVVVRAVHGLIVSVYR